MNISFIDLFSGIGGFHQAFSAAGAHCVFANDYDEKAASQYLLNYKGSGEYFVPGPLSKWTDEKNFMVPEHNILVAGFPCQPFSQAGVAKYNSLGWKHGFEHKTKGTLFHDVCRILKYHKPKAFLLENVKNLKGHDSGKTWEVIQNSLTSLGYTIYDSVIDAAKLVPQHRERVYIIGFKDETGNPTSIVHTAIAIQIIGRARSPTECAIRAGVRLV